MTINIKRIIHKVWCNGKVISKHKSFWLAQTAIEKWVKIEKIIEKWPKIGKINNNYSIETVIKKEKIK